jgi:hypothetical protein
MEMIPKHQRKNLTFCILTVLNFSKKANDPPPVPYLCISSLQYEYERLQSMQSVLFDSNDQQLPEHIGLKYIKSEISKLLNDKQNIINRFETAATNTITTLCNNIKTATNQPTLIKYLGELIEFINNSNAVTLIGTLEFTDTIAKYGLNQITCQTDNTDFIADKKNDSD